MTKRVSVILLADVAHIGHKDEIKSVAMGFAKNWLIRKKLASVATPAMIALATQHRASVESKQKNERVVYEKLLGELEGFTLRLRPKKNKQGTLYEGIDASTIAEKLKEKKIVLDPKCITLKEPIKQAGEYTIPVAFSKDITTAFTLVIQ